jgi:hypothetical protein
MHPSGDLRGRPRTEASIVTRKNPLKRIVEVQTPEGDVRRIQTVGDAINYIERYAADDPRWLRTRRLLDHAATEGSLRRIRAATRAFAEAVAKPEQERAG